MPKNLGVHTFPDPVGHFGAHCRPFWILQAVRHCRRWASAPFAARLIFLWLFIYNSSLKALEVHNCENIKNKTWSLGSNSSLSKTFALASLKSSDTLFSPSKDCFHWSSFWLRKNFESKKVLGLNNLGSENSFGSEIFFGMDPKKNLGLKKMLIQNGFWIRKNFRSKNFWHLTFRPLTP